jgi:hypothetical protein
MGEATKFSIFVQFGRHIDCLVRLSGVEEPSGKIDWIYRYSDWGVAQSRGAGDQRRVFGLLA